MITFKVATGADVNVINVEHLKLLGKDKKDVRSTTKSLIGANSKKLDCIGYVTSTFTWGSKQSEQRCYVCNDVKIALLGKPAIKELGIVKVTIPETYSCNTVEDTNAFISKFPNVFTGLGKIKGNPIHIELSQNNNAFHLSAPRQVALPFLEPLKEELRRMEEMGVIRKVDQPTDWCHPIVIVPKQNGKIRLCLDLTKLNIAVKREFY